MSIRPTNGEGHIEGSGYEERKAYKIVNLFAYISLTSQQLKQFDPAITRNYEDF